MYIITYNMNKVYNYKCIHKFLPNINIDTIREFKTLIPKIYIEKIFNQKIIKIGLNATKRKI